MAFLITALSLSRFDCEAALCFATSSLQGPIYGVFCGLFLVKPYKCSTLSNPRSNKTLVRSSPVALNLFCARSSFLTLAFSAATSVQECLILPFSDGAWANLLYLLARARLSMSVLGLAAEKGAQNCCAARWHCSLLHQQIHGLGGAADCCGRQAAAKSTGCIYNM